VSTESLSPTSPAPTDLPRRVAPLWAVAGVSALFAWAVWRLGWRGLLTIRAGLGELEWAMLVVLTVAFVYGEGYRALDRRWVPGLIERARALRFEHRSLVRLLAPLHGMALIAVSRGRLVRAWLGTLAIVSAVLMVRALPEPWRGIVDFSVAAALAWGLIAIVRRVPAVLRA